MRTARSTAATEASKSSRMETTGGDVTLVHMIGLIGRLHTSQIVQLSLLRVRQRRVGFGYLLKVLGRFGIVRVLVGMPLDRELPVSLLQSGIVCVLVAAEDLVEIVRL